MKKNMFIIITTGGSGGHIFPAEATALELLKKGFDILFVTDKRGLNFEEKLPTKHIRAQTVSGPFLQKIVGTFKLGIGLLQALFLLIRRRPAMVIGFGGYASIPTVVAAQILCIPVVLHEQNALLGKSNRFLAHRIAFIATSFPKTELIPQKIKTIQIGMPLRAPILEKLPAPYPSFKEEFNLVIFGGSQGAKIFGEFMPRALLNLPEELRAKICLTQQVRKEELQKVKTLYEHAGFKKVVCESFFSNMPEILAQAHLVIGRAGASTITELFAMGRPAILIPLPTSADNHQFKNARYFTETGAGYLIHEKDLTVKDFSNRLLELFNHPELLEKASACALKQANTTATKKFAEKVQTYLKEKC
ncbi:MAG: undecaprenyldiphospho-muramoylpentapeptide beta-N-acetylglucosaminyltransferase [Alphaproteobacteria bacterium]|nr:undecaprenyldiphospho-muramoylpentapeptide beta-N-acetylglucosaminyltransferase [Alphaproteobacteria bacterium]